ncbi:hypothetical protein F8M41_011712 [Gigaspora margarita]|uniref:Uncharacterized protein n=1 Tax=Gigaspora margarita TaxID=4874 RepID=A0A8H3X1Z5_GIGMA|nr:hypothetical protein F8M41_011712 [Gigaspora margarita]
MSTNDSTTPNDGFVSVKYGLQSNEITIHHHDENEKYHGCLKLVEADKPKQFKIYKQAGQYFDINGVIT